MRLAIRSPLQEGQQLGPSEESISADDALHIEEQPSERYILPLGRQPYLARSRHAHAQAPCERVVEPVHDVLADVQDEGRLEAVVGSSQTTLLLTRWWNASLAFESDVLAACSAAF